MDQLDQLINKVCKDSSDIINTVTSKISPIYPDNLPVKDKSTPVPKKLAAEQYYELLDFNDDDNDGQGSGQGQYTGHGGGHDKWDESKGDSELADDITKNILDKSTTQTQKSRGHVPGDIAELISNLSKKREVDWRNVFKRLVGNKRAHSRRTLMRRDRRLPELAHIKGRVKDRIGVPVIVGDESGSVSDTELQNAIGECLHICKQMNTDLWYVPVDTKAHKPHKITSNQRTFKRSACGGTVLEPALDMIKEARIELTALVCITDGYIDDSDVTAFANTKKQVIFLITTDGQIPDSCSSYSNVRAFKLKPTA